MYNSLNVRKNTQSRVCAVARIVTLFLLAWYAPQLISAEDDPPLPRAARSNAKVFLIGNSLTWDAMPSLLDGDVQWHVDCGRSLKYIHDHPEQPCVKSSVSWPTALKKQQYDFLCVQPFTGSNLDSDVAVISKWMSMQPSAIVILHTGWSRADEFEQSYHAKLDDKQTMVHSLEYFAKLQTELQARHPNREIRSTRAIELLDAIWHDVGQATTPFDKFNDLYRDEIHLTTQAGRYLMHNALRHALGQVLSSQGFQVEEDEKDYLDGKLKSVLGMR